MEQTRNLFAGLVVCAVCAAAALLGCGDAGEPGATTAAEIRRIILISIDTLRADALGSYGNPARSSENLDRIAAGGVRFETCIAPTPLTLPSHATLLTGLHPLQHGLLVNSQSALSTNVATLAEILQAQGWNTGAVVSSEILHHRYGLDRGFSSYSDDAFSSMLHHAELQTLPSANARDTTLTAINWISTQRPDENLFLFLHYVDPQAPYSAPARFANAFPDDGYLAEVAFTDAWIGKLASYLEEHDLLADTLFVITSDHGEALGQHGMPSHGYFLYDEVLRVPLIFSGAGVPSGVVAAGPVGLVDVVPTLLALLNLPPQPDLPGRDILASFPPADDPRALISVSYEPAIGFGWSPLWSLSTRGEKFILAPRPEYYRTTADPGELQNVAAVFPERARTLEKVLRERAAGYLARYERSIPVGLNLATTEQLMALGYSAPSALPEFALDDFSGRDPKDTAGLILRMNDFHAAVARDDFEAAGEILDELHAADPNIPAVKHQRSLLFVLRAQWAELLAWQDQMPADFRSSATQRYRRAVALGHLDRRREAMAILRETLEQQPKDSLCRYELAKQLSQNGQPQEAMREYTELLRTDPRNKAGRLNYALLLKQSGDRHAAINELRVLIETHPTYAKAFRNLGLELAGVGDRRAAISMLEHAIELQPKATNRPRTEEIIAALRESL